MTRKRDHEEWMADVENRQRNHVFPYTLKNETDGYRQLYIGDKPFSRTLMIGFLLLVLAMIAFLLGIIWTMVVLPWKEVQGSWWSKTVAALGPYALVLAGFGLLVYLMGRAAKKSIAQAHASDNADHNAK